MDETDYKFLRQAFAVARRSRAHGNYPFASILVDEHGEVLLEAENTVNSERDCTGHAEVNLVRAATRGCTPQVLARSTVYASAEPCAMCAGALYWSGIGRLVYALSKQRATEIEHAKGAGAQLPLGCRAILGAGERQIEIEGPALEAEAEQVVREA
ncbi:MAG: nucleoside deaminase [Pyrinomonadaceae bacterium]